MKPILFSLVFLGATLQVHALDPVESKLFSSRKDGNTFDDSFGLAMAGSDRWLVVGETGNSEKGSNAGAAYLFDANTGALKRKLLASDGAAGDSFGSAVAVSGNRIVVGAPGKDSGRGKAYLFDAVTGREVEQMVSSSPSDGDRLGAAVAIAGDSVVVGVPGDDSGLGSVHVYSIQGLAASSEELFKSVAAPRVAGSGFGTSVDTDGTFLVVGAPDEASSRGSVHLFDRQGNAQLLKITTSASAGDRLGFRVALACGRVFASRPDAVTQAGAVNIYDMVTGNLVRSILSPVIGFGAQFGFGMAVRENMLLVGQPEENSGGSGRMFVFDRDGLEPLAIVTSDGTPDDKIGSTVAIGGNSSVFASADPGGNAVVYRFSKVLPPIYGTLGLGLRVGDAAPGAGAAKFGQVTAAVLGADDEEDILFRAVAGRVSGVWDRFTTSLQPTTLTTSNLSLVPTVQLFVKGFGVPLANNSGMALMPASFKVPNVTSSSADAILLKDGPLTFTLVRLGFTFNTTSFGGSGVGTLAAISQVVQSTDTVGDRFAMAGKFRVGSNGVSAINDSVVLVPDINQALDAADQENMLLPGTGGPTRLGQISPRVAFANKLYVYHAAVQSTTIREGLFIGTFDPGPSVVGAQMAGQGDTVDGAQIDRFLGEAVSGDDKVVFRAKVSGSTITEANNEMLISNRFGSLENVLQKGEAIGTLPVFPGTVLAKVLRFWSVNEKQVVALVQLKGPRTTPSNDVALILANEAANNFTILLQEGGTASGCDGSRIGVIQSVEVDSEDRHYYVIASLTGAVAGQDQALFIGNLVDAPLGRAVQRRPVLEMRKGSLFRTEFGNQAKITSMAFGVRSSDVTGASEKGLPTAVGDDGRAALILKFSTGGTQAVEMQLD